MSLKVKGQECQLSAICNHLRNVIVLLIFLSRVLFWYRIIDVKNLFTHLEFLKLFRIKIEGHTLWYSDKVSYRESIFNNKIKSYMLYVPLLEWPSVVWLDFCRGGSAGGGGMTQNLDGQRCQGFCEKVRTSVIFCSWLEFRNV